MEIDPPSLPHPQPELLKRPLFKHRACASTAIDFHVAEGETHALSGQRRRKTTFISQLGEPAPHAAASASRARTSPLRREALAQGLGALVPDHQRLSGLRRSKCRARGSSALRHSSFWRDARSDPALTGRRARCSKKSASRKESTSWPAISRTRQRQLECDGARHAARLLLLDDRWPAWASTSRST